LGTESILGGTVLPSEERVAVLTESSRLLTMALGNLENLTNQGMGERVEH